MFDDDELDEIASEAEEKYEEKKKWAKAEVTTILRKSSSLDEAIDRLQRMDDSRRVESGKKSGIDPERYTVSNLKTELRTMKTEMEKTGQNNPRELERWGNFFLNRVDVIEQAVLECGSRRR